MDGTEYLQRYSKSLVVKEMQNQSAMRYCYIFTRMGKIKNNDHPITNDRIESNWNSQMLLVGIK
jgi:hypothetical protein